MSTSELSVIAVEDGEDETIDCELVRPPTLIVDDGSDSDIELIADSEITEVQSASPTRTTAATAENHTAIEADNNIPRQQPPLEDTIQVETDLSRNNDLEQMEIRPEYETLHIPLPPVPQHSVAQSVSNLNHPSGSIAPQNPGNLQQQLTLGSRTIGLQLQQPPNKKKEKRLTKRQQEELKIAEKRRRERQIQFQVQKRIEERLQQMRAQSSVSETTSSILSLSSTSSTLSVSASIVSASTTSNSTASASMASASIVSSTISGSTLTLATPSASSTSLTCQEERPPQRCITPEPSGSGLNQGSPVQDDESETCPICFEAWTNSGEHRLCTLKCGHLFGNSCILKWIKSKGTCPQCNKKAKKADIILLYAKSVKQLDTSARDEALRELEQEKERRRLIELETAQAKIQYQLAMEECNKLKAEVNRQQQQLAIVQKVPEMKKAVEAHGDLHGIQVRNPRHSTLTNQSSQDNQSSFKLIKSIKISEIGNCRVCGYCADLGALVVTQPSTNALFPGFGVKKVNMLDMKTCEYVAVHSNVIRDISFSSGSLMLSASTDKTVKLTSLVSNTPVQRYECSQPVWSCCWNKDDPKYFYTGLSNGSVNIYDVRNTTNRVESFDAQGSRSPVVSLQYVPKGSAPVAGEVSSGSGLLVAQLNKCSFYEGRTSSHTDYKLHILPVKGNITNVAYGESSRQFLVSCRPTTTHPAVTHKLCHLYAENVSLNIISSQLDRTFYGGKTQKSLAKSSIFPHPNQPNNNLLCVGDEAGMAALIFDTSTDSLKQRLCTQAPPIDCCNFTVNDSNLLACLTDKYVKIHKWT
ncbi:unnamed protein product [Owenia fusiformis]|uniref:RING-type E3 ubiquitin transferase n=1 Tax=Owenia fusiformis TaxID=6347 RepID=A0A8S4NZQ8_OWEFU|nr:unnamed protein product [Owenia fusiformis]